MLRIRPGTGSSGPFLLRRPKTTHYQVLQVDARVHLHVSLDPSQMPRHNGRDGHGSKIMLYQLADLPRLRRVGERAPRNCQEGDDENRSFPRLSTVDIGRGPSSPLSRRLDLGRRSLSSVYLVPALRCLEPPNAVGTLNPLLTLIQLQGLKMDIRSCSRGKALDP